RADRIALEVQRQTINGYTVAAGGKFEHLALHHIRQAMYAANTVRHGHDRPLVPDIGAGRQAFDTALDQFRNFCGIELHDSFLPWLIRPTTWGLRLKP